MARWSASVFGAVVTKNPAIKQTTADETTSPQDEANSTRPGFHSGVVMRHGKNLEAYGNVFENVPGMTLADIKDVDGARFGITELRMPHLQPLALNLNQSPNLKALDNTSTMTTKSDTQKEGVMPFGTFVGIKFLIANHGAPTNAFKYPPYMRAPSFEKSRLPMPVVQEHPFIIRDKNGGIAKTITLDETMVARAAAKPIDASSPVEGWLLYFFPDVDYLSLGPEANLEVSFEDSLGSNYTTKILRQDGGPTQL